MYGRNQYCGNWCEGGVKEGTERGTDLVLGNAQIGIDQTLNANAEGATNKLAYIQFEDSDRTNGKMKKWLESAQELAICIYKGRQFGVYIHEDDVYKRCRFLLLSQPCKKSDLPPATELNSQINVGNWLSKIDVYVGIPGLMVMDHKRINVMLIERDISPAVYFAALEESATDRCLIFNPSSSKWVANGDIYSYKSENVKNEEYIALCFLKLS